MGVTKDGTFVPKQERAKKTYEAILLASQLILEEAGLEALNSNAIVERAGVTAPVFYRYFKDKYALLAVLGQRLTDAQNEIYIASNEAFDPVDNGLEKLETQAYDVLKKTYDVTKGFTGAYALLVSLRAVPSLARIRQDSNQEMAQMTAARLCEARSELTAQEAYDRCRLAIEIGYTAIEMLLEEPKMNKERVLRQAAASAYLCYANP